MGTMDALRRAASLVADRASVALQRDPLTDLVLRASGLPKVSARRFVDSEGERVRHYSALLDPHAMLIVNVTREKRLLPSVSWDIGRNDVSMGQIPRPERVRLARAAADLLPEILKADSRRHMTTAYTFLPMDTAGFSRGDSASRMRLYRGLTERAGKDWSFVEPRDDKPRIVWSPALGKDIADGLASTALPAGLGAATYGALDYYGRPR